jgi:hypothetical protein
MCDFFKNTDEIISNEKIDNYSELTEFENITIYEDSQNEISEDEIFTENNENKINIKKNLTFTNVLKIMKNIKLDIEYKKWLSVNEEHVKNAFYIIQTKYLNDININNISLQEFSIFCFLSN